MTAEAAHTVKADELDRIDPRNRKAQGEGEEHIIHKNYPSAMGAKGEGEMHLKAGTVRVKSFISGGWKSDEDYQRWRDEEDRASAKRAAEIEARKRNSIVGRLKAVFSKLF
jgi:hypothetical protein